MRVVYIMIWGLKQVWWAGGVQAHLGWEWLRGLPLSEI